MLEIIEAFRTQLGGRPLLLVAALFAIGTSVARRRRGDAARDSTAGTVRLVAILGAIGLVAYPAIALWYAWDPHFFDNAEPTMPSVAWMFHLGKPLYPAVDSPERYAHIYGPVAFIVQAAVLDGIGPSIWASKFAGAAAGIAALIFLGASMRRQTTLARAAVLTGACALLLLTFRHASFWNRPDSLQLAAVTIALYCAGLRRWQWSTLFVGLASGALWNMKFTGPLYSLPVLALLYARFGALAAAGAVAIAAATACAPFALFSHISFVNYADRIRLSGRTGLLLSALRQNIEWATFLTLPLLLARVPDPRAPDANRQSISIGALLAGVCGVAIAAAKPGAGPYHLMPFALIAIYFVAERIGERPLTMGDPAAARAVTAAVLVATAIAAAQQTQLAATMLARSSTHEAADINGFLDTHQGTVEMGYGRSESLSHARPIVVFRTGMYSIDQPAIREEQLQGVALPPTTVDEIAGCRVKYWLVPKSEPPFSGVNSYAAVLLQPLYPEILRQRFAATHVRRETTELYDVWECRSDVAK